MNDISMNDISLHVYTFTCVNCKAHWTHSEPVMRTEDGGYIDLASPSEFNKWLERGAFVTCYQSKQLRTPICHNCLYSDLPEGWPQQVKKDVPHVKRKELSDEALNALLRP